MPIRIFSQKGTCTVDNRDVVTCTYSSCGTAILSIVLDGATSCPSSGDFSRDLATFINIQFCELTTAELVDEKSLLKILKSAQIELQHKYVCDFSSLLLLLKNGEQLFIINAGDGCLGFIDDTHTIEWKTCVHTFANTLQEKSIDNIKNDPLRHILTKSFKAKKYVTPDIQHFNLPGNTNVIIATDGFWALTNAEQSALITQTLTEFEPEDDASFIIIDNEQ